ncbi:MAG: hypothetical protein H8F28_03570, partial [Fibrella sp.]|nr:hypothetical protein [Armatimonadota bacterium]
MDDVIPKLNDNALVLDLSFRYGAGSLRAVGQGLLITFAGGFASVSAGHALIEGLVELPVAATNIATAPGWNHIWLKQAGTVQVVTGTTAAPDSNSCFIGSVNVVGAAGSVDTSGVVYAREGFRVRETADPNAPSDAPPASVMLFTKTLSGTWMWDGAA